MRGASVAPRRPLPQAHVHVLAVASQAAAIGSVAVVSMLMENGADVSVAVAGGVSALTVAAGQGDAAMVRGMLRAAGFGKEDGGAEEQSHVAKAAAHLGVGKDSGWQPLAARQLTTAANIAAENGLVPAENAAYRSYPTFTAHTCARAATRTNERAPTHAQRLPRDRGAAAAADRRPCIGGGRCSADEADGLRPQMPAETCDSLSRPKAFTRIQF